MTITRREFARLAALASAAGLELGHSAIASAASAPQQYGVQLFSVRQLIANDLPAVLRAIREIGYAEIEFFGSVYSHAAKELRAMLVDADLKAPSGLFRFAELESSIEYASALGLTYMVCPEIPKQYTASLEGMKQAGAEFNRIGERIRAAGMQLAYHNGNSEFLPFEGTTAFALLMENTDPSCLVSKSTAIGPFRRGRS